MKIVQIGANLVGAQKVIEEGIHRRLIEENHSSYILYIRGHSNLPDTIHCENLLENLMSRVLRKIVGKRLCFAYLQTMRIICILNSYHPDVVHLHVLHGGYIDYPILLSYLSKKQIPVVYTMHDLWAQTGGCYHYADCKEFRTGCASCPLDASERDESLDIPAKVWFKKKKLLSDFSAIHIVAVSKWVAKEFQKGFLNNCPIDVIYNGIEYPEIKNVQLCKPRNKKIQIICIAISWGNMKGFDILAELALMLGESFEFLMVGEIDKTLKLNAPKNMTFYGLCTNREELFLLLRNADLHVTASPAETFGMTMVEAAMAGIRTVGFDRTAIGEILSQIYGISVKDYTAKGLYCAIKEVVETGNSRLTQEEVNTVCKHFSIQRMTEEYLELYKSMLEGL